jgi:hypothetical protein
MNTPPAGLPPDGTIIRVSPWRRQIFWVGAAGMGFLALCVISYAVQIGRPAVALEAIGVFLMGLASARWAICGVAIDSSGLKARSTFRTFNWRWDEIERFELRERGETPRFQVHLKNGKVRGFLGFFARSPEEEERARELFQALQTRLRMEQASVE